MNKKGAVISLDALFGAGLALALFFAATFYLSQVEEDAFESFKLKRMANDVLVTLEKEGALSTSVASGDYAEVRSLLAHLPVWACAEVRFYSENDFNNSFFIVRKAYCGSKLRELSLANRTFVDHNGSAGAYYFAEARVWRTLE